MGIERLRTLVCSSPEEVYDKISDGGLNLTPIWIGVTVAIAFYYCSTKKTLETVDVS